MTNNELIDWDVDIVVDDEEVYESLVRAIARTEGFGLFFVRCIEKDRAKLEQRLKKDLSKLRFERLELQEELKDGNLYRRVAEVSRRVGSLNGLFISGLEKSLDPYVKSGYGGAGDYYNKDRVPRLLGHLNLQRERFRDDFPFCLIFFLSAFGIKYIARRAPDFFDWRSGLFEFVADEAKLGELAQELWGDYIEYLNWTETQRLDRIREIQALIDEDRQTSSGKVSLLLKKASILLANQSLKEVIASIDKAIEFIPNNYRIWYVRGGILDFLNRCEEAISSLDKAIELKPNEHEVWKKRGTVLSNLNRYEEAISSFDKAIELKPDDHEAWNNRAIMLSNLNRYEEAIVSYDKVIELKPDDHEVWNNRGIALGNLSRYEEAIASFDQAIELKLDYHEAWDNRGHVLFCQQKYAEAIDSFSRAIAINPTYANAFYNRACNYTFQGAIDLAFVDLTEALRLSPEEYRKLAETDPDLEPLREDPRFEKLLGLATIS